jgi:hypothetical protein
MGKFIIDSQICTNDEQSKQLLKMGLNPYSADMALHFSYVDTEGTAYYMPYPIGLRCTGIPAWSLARLVTIAFDQNGPDSVIHLYRHSDPFEDIIDFLGYQIEAGHIKPEYLK